MNPSLNEALADRYHIVRELGRGGMARVFLADDLKHGRQVAIKVMLPAVAEAAGQERFLREIEIAARLTHPHIIPLHDSGVAAGQFYYVMPYISGESLRARLAREGTLPLEESLKLAREIAGALGHAHSRGLVHRDVKPENILLADGIALVADFGIARVLDADPGSEKGRPPRSSPVATEGATKPAPQGPPRDGDDLEDATTLPAGLTARGTIVGTPRYMSPEQVRGDVVDTRTDVYSLACVLYEMLAGHPPFMSPVRDTLFRQHLTELPAPIATKRSGVPPGVAAVLERALSKDPGARHPTALAFAEALAAATSPGAPAFDADGADTGPHNLPRRRTRFVGRERELREAEELLKGTRLLTLTGIGGCGKTRLAVELADRVRHTFPDGAWFVDLAPVQDGQRLGASVATTLGVQDARDISLVDRVAAHVSNSRMLLILDNCEHLISHVADFVEVLLTAAPHLKLLLTSREGLGVAGEQVLALGSMGVPPPSATDPAVIVEKDSVRLFVDRARVSVPGFNLDSANAGAVAEICRRLDGIPLAIELAAVRVKALSVHEIQARLDDRFRLLTGGSRTALQRHQTLRSAIDWSFDLLSEPERRLFRLMAVFSGGWSLDAAVRVAGDDADEFDVLDTLTRLIEKSLVVPRRLPDGSTWYTMLETVRQYARERLDESEDGPAARKRHLDYYAALSELASQSTHGADQKSWFDRMDRERENILAAHALCDRIGAASSGLVLAYGWAAYWNTRGLFQLGLNIMCEALRRPGAEAATPGRNMVLNAAAHYEVGLGRYLEARAHTEEALSIARGNSDPQRISQALRLLGGLTLDLEGPEAARPYALEAVEFARRSGHTGRLAHALNDVAEIERAVNPEAAIALYAEALTLHRERGDHSGVALNLLNLGATELLRGRSAESRKYLLESLVMAEAMEFRRIGVVALYMVGGLAAQVGNPLDAARFHGAVEGQREATGFHMQSADQIIVDPLLSQARQALGDETFLAAVAAGEGLNYEEAVATARRWLDTYPPPTGSMLSREVDETSDR